LAPWYGPGPCKTCKLAPHESVAEVANAHCGEAQNHFSSESRSDHGQAGPKGSGAEEGSRERSEGAATGTEDGDPAFIVALPGHFRVSSSTFMLIGRNCAATPPQIGQYLRHISGVSRRHCLIVSGVGSLLVYDLDSTNGTFVDNRRVLPKAARSIAYQELPVSLSLGSGMVCTIERRL
jgi:hypothetical protein